MQTDEEIEYVTFESVFETMTYPAGEVHVSARVAPSGGRIVETHCRTAEDLFAVAMASRIRGFYDMFFIPHMPFARHDHRRDVFDGYPIDVVSHLLEGVDIVTADPHSDVTGNLWRHIPQSDVVDLFRTTPSWGKGEAVFVVPDAGASKKAHTWLRPDDARIYASKVRDRETGKLSGFRCDVNDEDCPRDLVSSDIVIVDDICDGGGTFLGLVDVLREHGAQRFHLAVTHGLFQESKLDALLGTFESITTFDTPHLRKLSRYQHLNTFTWRELFTSASDPDNTKDNQ